MNWFEQQRQNYIAELVSRQGHINRSDICERFGVTLLTASHDIRRFLALNPEVLTYNFKSKRYEVRK